MPELREVFEMTTKQMEPDVGAWREQEKRQRRASRTRKIGGFAVAAAIGLVAGVVILGTRADPNATPEPGVNPADVTPEEQVATDFVEAYGAFDAEKAITYLADDADISELMTSVGAQGVEGTLEEFRLLISLMEAQGYEQILDSCEETGSSSTGTAVHCAFDFHLIRSNEIGRGPFSGSGFDVTVRDGEIVGASMFFEVEGFSPQVWEPFASWVSTTYPEDAAVMYEDETYSGARLTAESIELWGQHTQGYVAAEIARMVLVAERFMEARNAYNAETAMSLLADDGATVLLMHDNALWPDMPTVRLNRDELALALEAERLYGVRYGSFECQRIVNRDAAGVIGYPGPVDLGEAQILCSFLMDNRLRQIDGLPPVESSFALGFRGDRIAYLSFPWLNVGFPAGKPAEGARFVEWVEAEHPEAGAPEFRDGEHGELLRIV
ncbi:MAG TPA: hypothetical protein VJ887_04380, partial [Actinomycetota bacterium]|nr:hypothetical protein [Actinomycetota bacterium]